jgi:hypothetical protein
MRWPFAREASNVAEKVGGGPHVAQIRIDKCLVKIKNYDRIDLANRNIRRRAADRKLWARRQGVSARQGNLGAPVRRKSRDKPLKSLENRYDK